MKIVLSGCLCENVEQEKEIVDEFEKEFGKGFKVLGSFKTLPGQGGEGGRSEVVVEMPGGVIPRAAVHPWHLSGLFRWWDDYLDNNGEIVPDEARSKFFQSSGSVSEITEPQKPKCKLVGEDGNVFSIIGRVSGVLKKAGLKERAKEFQQKAFASSSYDEVLRLCGDFVDIE